ncbi:hypothetical protein K488DRAFT_45334 [Vararia minispora EC-137]|uniref:Uncharacterized protein n=1 Tax=Vararia minispora EC-137 TaxID=1314806 RepID=A0ACB8QRC2_9AGAM|nr:hypothetical protein K488DRAFT_45334 [Vararia minispora EC-137]
MADSIETARYLVFVSQVHYCDAVVVWEWITSLILEWRLFWTAPWTPVKAVYLFCRYWVLATIPYHLWAYAVDHSLETCQRVYKFPPALAIFNILAGETVLLLRTYAFFNRDKRVLAGLVILLSGVLAYQLFVAAAATNSTWSPARAGPCLPQSEPHAAHILGKFQLAPLLFDTIVTTMIIVKAVLMRRRNGPSSHIIQVFLREGVFYYIMISLANLINGIFYIQPRRDISAIAIPFTVMLGPVLACRLVSVFLALSQRDHIYRRSDHRHPSASGRFYVRASRTYSALTRQHGGYQEFQKQGHRLR